MGDHCGGIEPGDTKFVCVVGRNPDQTVAETRFPTADYDDAIEEATSFFASMVKGWLL